jgi:hypothetical protein
MFEPDPRGRALMPGAPRPYTRWWWLGGPFREADVARQLDWLKSNGFGGVELAWLHPGWQDLPKAERPAWLSPQWTEIVAFAKRHADRIGLGCDFTFGSCWPIGPHPVPSRQKRWIWSDRSTRPHGGRCWSPSARLRCAVAA